MKIAITGHRPNKLGNDYDLTSPLIRKIEKEIIAILSDFIDKDLVLITGMALGIDTLFAQIAIQLNLPFIAAIPCKGQASIWPSKSKEKYFDIVENSLCTKHWVSTEDYSPQRMNERNHWMVQSCDLLIAVWDGSNGGTANCIKYAKSINRNIIIINPLKL